jgi:hypothetical protein
MRLITIFILCSMLAGCPLIYEATVRNDTNIPVEIAWQSNNIASSKIESTNTVVIPWFVLCVTVSTDKASKHYQVPEFLPDNVQTSGRFSSRVTFPIVINDEGLNFENKSGDLIPIQKVSECGRT